MELVLIPVKCQRKRHPVGPLGGRHLLFANEKCAGVVSSFLPIVGRQRLRRAQTGEADRAIVALQKLLSIPYVGPLAFAVPLTPALLRLDPMFDTLRKDPRFQKLCEEKKQ
jgi:hypothetical protein